MRFVERVRYAGDEPLALDRSWIPADLGRRLRRDDLEQGSLYDALATRSGVTVVGGSERISPAVPGARLRTQLGLPRGQAVFVVTRVVRDALEAGRTPRQPGAWRSVPLHRPLVSSASTRRAWSSGSPSGGASTSSGEAGGSYGSSTPVRPISSPARALA